MSTVKTTNRFELLSSPRAPKRKLQDSPPVIAKKARQGVPNIPLNPLMDDKNANLLEKLAVLGNCSASELNSIGLSLASLLNSFGEKLHNLAIENYHLNSQVENLISQKTIAENRSKTALDLKSRNETIVSLKKCSSTITLCNMSPKDFPDRSAKSFVHSISTSTARGLIKPAINSYRSKESANLVNVNISCDSVFQKKILEHEFRKNGIKNARFNWPKNLVAPIQTLRDRFSTLRKKPILIRPHNSCTSLNIFEKTSNGWIFLENVNIPPRKGSVQTLSSKLINTDNIYLTQL